MHACMSLVTGFLNNHQHTYFINYILLCELNSLKDWLHFFLFVCQLRPALHIYRSRQNACSQVRWQVRVVFSFDKQCKL